MCTEFSFGIQKLKRGQVWFVNEPISVTNVLRENKSAALNGSRPYFILNVNGIMVNCIPMTTNTVGTDTKDSNIIFKDPISGITSRLCINQICTKGIDEFTEYKYTFSEEAINVIVNRVKTCVFGEDTVITNRQGRIDVQEESKNIDAVSKKILPEEAEQFEMRLKAYFKKSASARRTEPIFRTKKEAVMFLNDYCDRPTKELCEMLGIEKQTVYTMRYTAKKVAYGKD